ncbi:MerR family transcriptional regulator [Nonomuraea africana]|uniref:DNA-binding transcriptional MerR regulator n=1 Tax=Nonomuraea africana TaxID=46171 RepID=A0ABR9KCF7_9ACTN|nr:MerR family transcriptional regulator [Nonomuraea africana]MBE1559703.1 DNA-binding transcriptional MerR regulator [Nonomuraea africana]
MSVTVGQVARLAGVTVRTLHHYDEIGLLSPSERSQAGYRRYTDADLERLQQVLFYRELGFGLEEIAAILDDPGSDAMTHLRRQHELLMVRIDRLRDMAEAIEVAMEARTLNITLTPEERFEVFGDFRPEQYDEEVERRWGGSSRYAESRRRVASYTKVDWLRLRAEAEGITEDLVAAMKAGLPAAGEAVMDLAERHRAHISRWFYDCTPDIHRCLGELYVTDARFTATIDAAAEGLAAYLRDAIDANADRHATGRSAS